MRYEPSGSRFWAEYRVRHNGATDANLDPDEPVPPVGSRLPGLHRSRPRRRRAAFRIRRHDPTKPRWRVENLTDELYAEFSNATFFRPEPGRNVKLSYRIRF